MEAAGCTFYEAGSVKANSIGNGFSLLRPPKKIPLSLPPGFLLTTAQQNRLARLLCISITVADSRMTFSGRTTKLMCTYYTAYLLRNPHAKPDVWEDMQKALKFLNLPIPER